MTVKLALTGPAETGLIARPTRGSPPCGRYVGACLAGDHDGQVAQLVEQRIENPRVGGSIPPLATKCQKAPIWGPFTFEAGLPHKDVC